jgi:hypothetical protein
LLVRTMTPVFQSILGDDVIFGNSESLAWLPTQNPLDAKAKPDGFWCYRPCFQSVPLHDIPARGQPAHVKLFESVCLADCKTKISNEAFGELVNHLRQLSDHTRTKARGCLYDCKTVRMVEVEPPGSIIRAAVCDFDTVCTYFE